MRIWLTTPERMNIPAKTGRNSRLYIPENGCPNRGLSQKSRITNARAVKGCPHKKNCTTGPKAPKMQLSKTFLRQRDQSLRNITSETGILLRMNRSIQVEGAFGVIKQDYGFRQFLLRGNKKVRTEMLIMAFGYNITSFITRFSKIEPVRSCLKK